MYILAAVPTQELQTQCHAVFTYLANLSVAMLLASRGAQRCLPTKQELQGKSRETLDQLMQAARDKSLSLNPMLQAAVTDIAPLKD
jgi:hypothetical protein